MWINDLQDWKDISTRIFSLLNMNGSFLMGGKAHGLEALTYWRKGTVEVMLDEKRLWILRGEF